MNYGKYEKEILELYDKNMSIDKNIAVDIIDMLFDINVEMCDEKECNKFSYMYGYCAEHYKKNKSHLIGKKKIVKEKIDSLDKNGLIVLCCIIIELSRSLSKENKILSNKLKEIECKLSNPKMPNSEYLLENNDYIINISSIKKKYPLKQSFLSNNYNDIIKFNLSNSKEIINNIICKKINDLIKSTKIPYDIEYYFSEYKKASNSYNKNKLKFRKITIIKQYLYSKIINHKVVDISKIKKLQSSYECITQNILLSLQDKYLMCFTREKTFDNMKYKNNLYFDFHGYIHIKNNMISQFAIEIDGIFHNDEINKKRDIIKNYYCWDNGISLLRINIYYCTENKLNYTKLITDFFNNIINNCSIITMHIK